MFIGWRLQPNSPDWGIVDVGISNRGKVRTYDGIFAFKHEITMRDVDS